jgi:nicotinate (nicotinamide) nucleotide adenylyltransferase
MQFYRRALGRPRQLAVLPGTFNPVTVAHVQLASAALPIVDEVVFVLPRNLPHKKYTGASFDQRIDMLTAALADQPNFSLSTTDGSGLFIDIARDCRSVYGPDVRLRFLCGRDAAERIVNWDYGRPDAFAETLREFELLVAARNGEFLTPQEYRHAVQALPLAGDYAGVSATEVRDRIRRGDAWEHLVPQAIREMAREIYR